MKRTRPFAKPLILKFMKALSAIIAEILTLKKLMRVGGAINAIMK
jgi:hypothetical protein